FRGVLRDQSQDAGRCIYRYHQLFAGPARTFTRKNLVVAVRLAPWADGTIRPHEATVPAARDAALAKIRTTGVHAEPVVMGFRDQPEEVERLMKKTEGGPP